MKSFNQHSDKKSENLQEDPFDDLTDLLWVGAAGAGIWGLSKGWDKFGKDAVASLPFAPDKWKAAKIDRKKEKDDEKEKIAKTLAGPSDTEKAQAKIDKDSADKKDKQTGADAAAMDYEKDGDGYIKNVKDAQEYKDKADKAPDGWLVSTGKGAFKKIKAGNVVQKKTADMLQKKYEADREAQGQRVGVGAEPEKKKVDKKDDDTKTDSHKPKGTMTITESNELQAIMALDDAGIKAEINRKGQVVIKKKDKKKAHIALEKSFKKGGWPTLKLEDVEIDPADELTNYVEMKMSAAAKKKKALWAKSSGGKKSLLKSKKRSKKVASGAIKIDKARGRSMAKARKKGGIRNEFELGEASNKKAMKKVADELEAIADKGGAEAPALFSMASRLRKGQLPTGQKVSKEVSAVFKKHGIREEVQKPRTAYEVVSEARTRVIANKPKWEPEDSEPRLS
jgi:hypothetical protein